MSLHQPSTPIFIKGPAAFLPEETLDNDALIAWMSEGAERPLKIRGSWIEHRSGIQKRHWASDEQACSDLAFAAATSLFEKYPEERTKIRQLVLATISGDYPTPPTAPLVQHRLGLENVGAFDLGAACAGFVSGLHTTTAMCAATGESQLLIAADIRSKFLRREDLATTALFGDGAAACVVTADPASATFRYIASQLFSDGSVADIISIPAGGTRLPYSRNPNPEDNFLIMKKGAVLFLKAVEGMAESASRFLATMGLKISDINWLVPHQANLHLIREVGLRLAISPDKVIETVQVTGNTSGASVGIALHSLLQRPALQASQRVLLVAAGGGGLAACALLETPSL
ncbi:ketoacyl-ACP synthase III [Bdellovibrionota bacterium FG-2]